MQTSPPACVPPSSTISIILLVLRQALPMLSEAELPPAVGLVLKLASESPLARAPAVRCVRGRVRSAAPGAAGGTLDAMRLAVLQHRDVAFAVLADIDADAKGAKPAAAPDAQVCSQGWLAGCPRLTPGVSDAMRREDPAGRSAASCLFSLSNQWILYRRAKAQGIDKPWSHQFVL